MIGPSTTRARKKTNESPGVVATTTTTGAASNKNSGQKQQKQEQTKAAAAVAEAAAAGAPSRATVRIVTHKHQSCAAVHVVIRFRPKINLLAVLVITVAVLRKCTPTIISHFYRNQTCVHK